MTSQPANFTSEEMRLAKECKRVIKDFRYFVDEYCYIEEKETGSVIKMKLWPEQERILPLITDNQLVVMLKARQLGLTWIVAMYVLWKMITNPLFLAVVISVTEDLSIEFLDRLYFILDRLPEWVKPPVKTRTKQVFEFQHTLNRVSTVKSLPTTEMGAQSKTPNLLVMDETCKNRMAKAIFNASYPGIEAAKGQVIVISNSIKEGAGWYWTRDLYIAAMRCVNKFKTVFLSWRAHPGRKPNFKEEMIASGMDERDVNENYPDTEEEAIEDRNVIGVFYSKQMADARKEKRICNVPWSPGFEVYTFWDLGVDTMSIWFMQHIGKGYNFIDYYENTGMGMLHYAKELFQKRPYKYGDHYMPHDVAKRAPHSDTEVALTLKEIAENLGIKPILTVPKAKDTQAVINAIHLGRNILNQCWFDQTKCSKGISCLENYRSEYDEDKQVLGHKPLDNWATHGADSFRTFLEGYKPKAPPSDVLARRRRGRVGGQFAYLGN